MAGKGERHLIGGDAVPVVRDANALHTTAAYINGDPACPGIERVFHQLLDDCGRMLNDLSGGNTLGNGIRQHRDAAGCKRWR